MTAKEMREYAARLRAKRFRQSAEQVFDEWWDANMVQDPDGLWRRREEPSTPGVPMIEEEKTHVLPTIYRKAMLKGQAVGDEQWVTNREDLTKDDYLWNILKLRQELASPRNKSETLLKFQLWKSSVWLAIAERECGSLSADLEDPEVLARFTFPAEDGLTHAINEASAKVWATP